MARFVFLKGSEVIEGPIEMSDCETPEQALNARYGDVPTDVTCKFELNEDNLTRVHDQVLATMAPTPDVEKIFTEGKFKQGGDDGGSDQAAGTDGHGAEGVGAEVGEGRSGKDASGALNPEST